MLSPSAGPGAASLAVYRFGEFTVDTRRGLLLRGAVEVPLRPKSFSVLVHLLAERGRLVGRAELIQAVWGHSHVTDGALTQCLIAIRRALGDDAHKIVRTVPKRGYLFQARVEEVRAEAGPEAPRSRNHGWGRVPGARVLTFMVPAVAIVMAFSLVGSAYFGYWPSSEPGAGPAAGIYTIAVLPFADMSPGRDQAHFADGVSEELINELTRVPQLRVIARTSSFAFRDSNIDVREIADLLGATYVMEGSVRRSGENVRITAKLVDATANTHVWTRTFERKLDDIFAVQREIASSVSGALHLTLTDYPGRKATRVDPAAYEHYLQGRFYWHRRAPGDVARAGEHYRSALAIDPNLAGALVGLTAVYWWDADNGETDPVEARTKMHELLSRALAVAPSSAEAHARMAGLQRWIGNKELYRRHWEQAKDLGSNSTLVASWRAGDALYQGDMDGMVEFARRAVSLDPLSAVNRWNLAAMLILADRLEFAERELASARALNPFLQDSADLVLAHIRLLQGEHRAARELAEDAPEGPERDQVLEMANRALGRDAEADAALARIMATPGAESIVRVAETLTYRGEVERAFDALRDVGDRRTDLERTRAWPTIGYLLRKSYFLRPLHGDPRWEVLLVEND